MAEIRLVQALERSGATVKLSVDEFPRGTPDPVWLAEVGQRGWIVLTKDTRIRYRKLEQETLLRHKVKAFVLTGGSVGGADMAQILGGAARTMARRGL